MQSETELSGLEIVVEFLKVIWMPAAEAVRVQNDLNVHSLNETSAAAERAGYAVCYVDLPTKVSGFAGVIEGKPHIVVNRAKSREHQQFTLPHELGHQVLHLNPSGNPVRSALPINGMAEFQAQIFAAAWVTHITSGKELEDVLKQNPEASIFLFLAVFMTGVILVVGLLAYLWSRLRTQPCKSDEEK